MNDPESHSATAPEAPTEQKLPASRWTVLSPCWKKGNPGQADSEEDPYQYGITFREEDTEGPQIAPMLLGPEGSPSDTLRPVLVSRQNRMSGLAVKYDNVPPDSPEWNRIRKNIDEKLSNWPAVECGSADEPAEPVQPPVPVSAPPNVTASLDVGKRAAEEKPASERPGYLSNEDQFRAWGERQKWDFVPRVAEPYSPDERIRLGWVDDLTKEERLHYYNYLMGIICSQADKIAQSWLGYDFSLFRSGPRARRFSMQEALDHKGKMNKKYRKDEPEKQGEDEEEEEREENRYEIDFRQPFVSEFDAYINRTVTLSRLKEEDRKRFSQNPPSLLNYVFLAVKDNPAEKPMKILFGKILSPRGYVKEVVLAYLKKTFSGFGKKTEDGTRLWLCDSYSEQFENDDTGDQGHGSNTRILTKDDIIRWKELHSSLEDLEYFCEEEAKTVYDEFFSLPDTADEAKRKRVRAEKILLVVEFCTPFGKRVNLSNETLLDILEYRKSRVWEIWNGLFADNPRDRGILLFPGDLDDFLSSLDRFTVEFCTPPGKRVCLSNKTLLDIRGYRKSRVSELRRKFIFTDRRPARQKQLQELLDKTDSPKRVLQWMVRQIFEEFREKAETGGEKEIRTFHFLCHMLCSGCELRRLLRRFLVYDAPDSDSKEFTAKPMAGTLAKTALQHARGIPCQCCRYCWGSRDIDYFSLPSSKTPTSSPCNDRNHEGET